MARAFDELRLDNERAQDASEFMRGLQQMLGGGVTPPIGRIRDIRPQDPSVDTFDQRYRGETPEPREGILPGYQERFLDPTKVISQRPTAPQKLPPSLNAPNVKAQTRMFELPEGFTLVTPSENRG